MDYEGRTDERKDETEISTESSNASIYRFLLLTRLPRVITNYFWSQSITRFTRFCFVRVLEFHLERLVFVVISGLFYYTFFFIGRAGYGFICVSR